MPPRYLNSVLCTVLVFALFLKQPGTDLHFPGVKDEDAGKALQKQKARSTAAALDTSTHYIAWLKRSGYSTSLIFLADMKLSMEVKRFYVIQPDSHRILNSFLVAHGSGKGSTSDSVVCSNTPGSLCTSTGKYKLGETLFGEYGKGYWLDGLDRSNNNARKRLIVFHYYLPQTTREFADHNYFSSGCPMLAKPSFDFCDSLIQLQKKPVLMYIYR